MNGQKRIRDYGIQIGSMTPGKRNSITDVEGVKVGHVTLKEGPMKTGETAVLPHAGNLFRDKVLAASCVLNGFGKTLGTLQIEEMGTIETPILLTNTLSTGIASDALIAYMLQHNEDIGVITGTVNPVICECNDGYLNDIRSGYVKQEHVLQAIQNADVEFLEGAVGAGTGMSCFQLKGGIGTASRQFEREGNFFAAGVLVLSNFGIKQELLIDGFKLGRMICELESAKKLPEMKARLSQS